MQVINKPWINFPENVLELLKFWKEEHGFSFRPTLLKLRNHLLVCHLLRGLLSLIRSSPYPVLDFGDEADVFLVWLQEVVGVHVEVLHVGKHASVANKLIHSLLRWLQVAE